VKKWAYNREWVCRTNVNSRSYYERFFSKTSKQAYERLPPHAEEIFLKGDQNPEKAFFDAGKYIVDHTGELIAVWDSRPAHGLGGTADIVSYGKPNGRPILLWIQSVEPGD
jgi:hypothetical protein